MNTMKMSGQHFVLSFSHFSFLIPYRYQSSSSGCRPQARAKGTRRGHSSVAQPSRPESYNHSGHMDGKCNRAATNDYYHRFST